MGDNRSELMRRSEPVRFNEEAHRTPDNSSL